MYAGKLLRLQQQYLWTSASLQVSDTARTALTPGHPSPFPQARQALESALRLYLHPECVALIDVSPLTPQ
jgi:hypothetical protein